MLNKMNSEVVRIVLLVGKVLSDDHKKYRQLVHMLLVFFFRSKVVCGTHATALELTLAEIAKKMRKAKKLDLREIREMLKYKGVYPSDIVFKQKFVEKDFNQRSSRYVLEQLESRGKKTELRPAPTITIEHIMPKTLNAGWKHISDSDHSDLLWCVGNLTLLSDDDNVVLSSWKFKKKKPCTLNQKLESQNL